MAARRRDSGRCIRWLPAAGGRGYEYGSAFQGLTALWRCGDELFAEVTLPEAAGGVGGYGVHPALLDAALHAAVMAHDGDGLAELALPFSWQGVSLHAAGASAVRARIARSGPSAVSVELADGLGLPVLSVASMVARPVTQQQLMAAVSGSGGDRLFELVWSPASPASHAETPSYEVFQDASAAEDPVVDTYERTHKALAAVQSWLTERDSGVLVVATRGAMALPGEDVTDLAGAAVWGLVRSAQTEHPGRIVLVDCNAPVDDTTLASALAVGEPQVLVRGGTVYTARVHASRAVDGVLVPPGDGPWRLGLSSAGTFENLQLEPVPNADAPLEPGQVRVAMRAIATNFRDIMIILGMFTHDALLGGEGAGVVVEVGPGVTEFAVGDSVYGFFPDGSGTLVAGDVRLLLPMPADWSYAEAAAISAVFTTAWMAFVQLADVKPGQQVLVHAARRWGRDGGGAVGSAFGVGGIPPRAGVSGIRCGRWVSTRTISAIRVAGFRGQVPGGDRWSRHGCGVGLAGWRFRRRLAASGRPRRGVPGDGQNRHPRSRRCRTRTRGVRYRAFDLFEPGRPRMHQYMLELATIRRRNTAAVAGHDL